MSVYKTKPTLNGEGGGGGTSVVANPELEGTEPELTGLEVEGVKYKVPQGGGGDKTVHPTVYFFFDAKRLCKIEEGSTLNVSALKQLYINNGISMDTELDISSKPYILEVGIFEAITYFATPMFAIQIMYTSCTQTYSYIINSDYEHRTYLPVGETITTIGDIFTKILEQQTPISLINTDLSDSEIYDSGSTDLVEFGVFASDKVDLCEPDGYLNTTLIIDVNSYLKLISPANNE